MINYRELPASIKNHFQPCETISPADVRYEAKPRFVEFPPNQLRGWFGVQTLTADEDGSQWLVRTYSPTYSPEHGSGYDVVFCRIDDNLDRLVELSDELDTIQLAQMIGIHPDRLNNGGKQEVLALALFEGDDAEWLEELILSNMENQ